MLSVEFPQVKSIAVSDITHVLKAATITNSEHFNNFCGQSLFER